MITQKDEREYIELVEGLRDTLYRLARSIVLDDAEVDDVLQDLYERAWRARDRVLNSQYPRAFLCRMARNIAIDRWRQRSRHRGDMALGSVASLFDGDKGVDMSDMASITRRLIAQLPERQRLSLQMRDVEGYEIEEIALVLECDESSVRMNLSRARKSIREQLITYMNYGVK